MENASNSTVFRLFSEWLLRRDRFPSRQRAVRKRYRMGRNSIAFRLCMERLSLRGYDASWAWRFVLMETWNYQRS